MNGMDWNEMDFLHLLPFPRKQGFPVSGMTIVSIIKFMNETGLQPRVTKGTGDGGKADQWIGAHRIGRE